MLAYSFKQFTSLNKINVKASTENWLTIDQFISIEYEKESQKTFRRKVNKNLSVAKSFRKISKSNNSTLRRSLEGER